ncbi:outer membrane protein [Legionella bozemanae]|uniref:outer membrane protein n=1 Tax=Legionella bozemanae TaxID=447 RepID=UPI00399C6BBC
MLRKTKLLGLVSLLLANPCFSGFYLGAGVGPEGAHFTQRSHVTRLGAISNTAGEGAFNVYDTEHFSGTGEFGTLFGGYSLRYKNFYLGAEANANISSVKYTLVNDELIHSNFLKTTFSIPNSEGISILPGYFFSDSFWAYGRVGYANGHVKIRESDPTVKSSTSNRSGIRYGAGVRYNLLDPRWTLMMDYSQINYTKIKSHVFEPNGGVTKIARIYPNTAQVAFGLIFNFDTPKKAFVK